MSKSIKLSEPVYEKLREFQGKRESFSEAVGRLLTMLEKVGELRDVLEGQIAFRNHQKERLEKLQETH